MGLYFLGPMNTMFKGILLSRAFLRSCSSACSGCEFVVSSLRAWNGSPQFRFSSVHCSEAAPDTFLVGPPVVKESVELICTVDLQTSRFTGIGLQSRILYRSINGITRRRRSGPSTIHRSLPIGNGHYPK